MKGGNGVRQRRTELRFVRRGKIRIALAETVPWMAPVSGANLTALPSSKAEASKNLENAESPSAPLVRGRLRPPKKSNENHR